jgi:hypothetical protein
MDGASGVPFNGRAFLEPSDAEAVQTVTFCSEPRTR